MTMRKIFIRLSMSFALLASVVAGVASCNKWLDVVPDDGIPSVETAFNLRSSAIRYLATCYSYMTQEGVPGTDHGMLTGDELWDLVGRIVTNTSARVPNNLFNIARGYQTPNTVYGNDFGSMYEGIRCCDILVEHINDVPDMTREEKDRWTAEATFLKAYYHFNLLKKWGPIPIVHESLPIDSDVETVRVYRDNVDDCFDYILGLLDQAYPHLYPTIPSTDEYGRITQPICAALKARVAAYAASPLFNGNPDEASLVDNQGRQLFPQKSDAEKLARWTYAMNACERAIKVADSLGFRLYDTSGIVMPYNDTLKITVAIRNSVTERYNESGGNQEVIWPNTQTNRSAQTMYQRLVQPCLGAYTDMLGGYRFLGVPIKIAEQFYTNHGLPIANDRDWEGVNTMELVKGDDVHAFYIQPDYTTIRLNFDREPRFYASLGFDGGKWFGQLSNYNRVFKPADIYDVECRMGGKHAKTGSETGPVTGYFPKKLIPIQSTWTANNSFSSYTYAWPMIRLTDLYLLYAECINEAEGPDGPHSAELFKYLDAIRSRAGIPDVKTAWEQYSNNPSYYKSKSGMRDIIHKERLNEFVFESQRFWDLRRWKEAPAEYQKGIYGFHVTGSAPEDYYVKTFIAEQQFGLKDYFWPIPTSYIEVNPNLVQNLGW